MNSSGGAVCTRPRRAVADPTARNSQVDAERCRIPSFCLESPPRQNGTTGGRERRFARTATFSGPGGSQGVIRTAWSIDPARAVSTTGLHRSRVRLVKAIQTCPDVRGHLIPHFTASKERSTPIHGMAGSHSPWPIPVPHVSPHCGSGLADKPSEGRTESRAADAPGVPGAMRRTRRSQYSRKQSETMSKTAEGAVPRGGEPSAPHRSKADGRRPHTGAGGRTAVGLTPSGPLPWAGPLLRARR